MPARGRQLYRWEQALMGAAALLLMAFPPAMGEARADGPSKARAKAPSRAAPSCRPQRPQKFLERRSFVRKRILDTEKHARAVRYLAERYGNAGDELTRSIAKDSAASHAKSVRFMGLPIEVHDKIAPALACVEKRIEKTCRGKSRYEPRAIGGLRVANTYRGAEISNHLFGIAIDIDPDRNPCCGCVDPWPTSPLCRAPAATPYQRTAMPKCWIDAFERYGFDWLGHDTLEDTMHFEFLGDPARIAR